MVTNSLLPDVPSEIPDVQGEFRCRGCAQLPIAGGRITLVERLKRMISLRLFACARDTPLLRRVIGQGAQPQPQQFP
jgi:hypothetical protein